MALQSPPQKNGKMCEEFARKPRKGPHSPRGTFREYLTSWLRGFVLQICKLPSQYTRRKHSGLQGITVSSQEAVVVIEWHRIPAAGQWEIWLEVLYRKIIKEL